MQIRCKSHAHHDVKPTQFLEKSCRLRASIVLPPLPWFSYDPVSEAEEEKEEEEEEGEGEGEDEEAPEFRGGRARTTKVATKRVTVSAKTGKSKK